MPSPPPRKVAAWALPVLGMLMTVGAIAEHLKEEQDRRTRANRGGRRYPLRLS